MLSRLLLLLLSLAVLNGCSSMKPEQFAGSTPRFALEEYFQGSSRAYGLVEDRFGTVRRQFTVDITGSWDGQVLTLVEDFHWNDGEQEQRIWHLTKRDEHQWEGRTADAIGTAVGKQYGNAFNLRYDFNLKLDGGRTRVHFDDWMFLMPDGVVLNRAAMSKFGVHLATVTIAFRKDAGPGVIQGGAAAAE